MSGNPVIALATRTYVVPKRNPDIIDGGTGGFKGNKRPNVSKKRKLGKKIFRKNRKQVTKSKRRIIKRKQIRRNKQANLKTNTRRRTQTPLLIVK